MQSVDNLSSEAKIAYQAFLDMSNSKKSHFNCLEAIESKYKIQGSPSIAESIELKNLLSNHDKNVLAFKTAMAAVTGSDEKQTLIELMS